MSRWRLRILWLIVAVSTIALGHGSRMRLADGQRLSAAFLPGGDSSVLIDDPDAAYHLRRVELALANGEVPQIDRLLNHPGGSAIPWPDFFDGLLASGSRLCLKARSGGEFAGRSEGDIERFLARWPPLLGSLTVVAVGWATLGLAAGSGVLSIWAALLAMAFYAAAPMAQWYAAYGRIDHHVLSALLAALALGSAARGLRSKELAVALPWSAMAGLWLGLGLLTFLGSAVLVAALGFSFFVVALLAERSERAPRLAGVLLFATAALVVSPAAAKSPWNQLQPGSLINLSEGVPRALLAASAGFLALDLLRRRGLGRLSAGALTLLGTLLLCWCLPGFLDGARQGFAWASRQNRFMDVVDESRPLLAAPWGWQGAVRDLGSWSLAAPGVMLVILVAAWRRRSAAIVLLPLLGAYLLMTLTQRRFGNTLSVPLAIATAGVCAESAACLWRSSVRSARALAPCLVLLPLVALGITISAAWSAQPSDDELQDLSAWRREVLSGLRSLRVGVQPAQFLDPLLGQPGAVLAPWGLGHLIEYHGRRPSIATNFGSFVGEGNYRAHAAALLEDTPDGLLLALDRLGADWIAVTPRQTSDLPAMARTAGWGPAQVAGLFVKSERGKAFAPRAQRSALVALALHRARLGDRAFVSPERGGMELVWQSARWESPGGRRGEPGAAGAGPVLSIWKRFHPQSTGELAPGSGLEPASLVPLAPGPGG